LASVLGAFLLLMITGGVIAYFGDRLGYVMGKRRVTIFGLRPRHTAQTLTVLSGIIIAGLALALLLVVNYTFRNALLNGEQLLLTNQTLSKSNHILSVMASVNSKVAKDAMAEANAAQSQAGRAAAVLNVSEKKLIVEEKTTTKAEDLAAGKQQALRLVTAQLAVERSQLAVVQKRVDIANQQVKADVQTYFDTVYKDMFAKRNGDLIFRNNQELGRDVISASSPEADIHQELVRFLNRLSRTASAMGATNGGNHRAVIVATINLFDKKAGSNTAQNTQAFVGEADSLVALSSNISSYGHGSVVVVAKAFGNSYTGEPVIVLLRPYANLLVIPAGTALGSTEITDSTSSVDDIVSQLQRLLLTQVRPTAIKLGVIPFDDPRTDSIEVGDVSLEQLYDIVSKVRHMSGPTIVTASAAEDTYSADKLSLSFSVSSAETTTN
jgi:uncharacterized protein (DUF3084 family)